MAPKTYTPPPAPYRAAVALQKAVAQLQGCGPLWGRWRLPWHRPAWAMKVDLAVTHLGTAAALLEEHHRPAVSATAASGSATNAAASARNASPGGLVLDPTAFLDDAKVATTDTGPFADWTPPGDGFSVPAGKYAWADNPPGAGVPASPVYVGLDVGGEPARTYDPRTPPPGKPMPEWKPADILAVAAWGDREGMVPASETDRPHPTEASTVYHDLEYAADVLETAQFAHAFLADGPPAQPNPAHDALLAVQVAMAKMRRDDIWPQPVPRDAYEFAGGGKPRLVTVAGAVTEDQKACIQAILDGVKPGGPIIVEGPLTPAQADALREEYGLPQPTGEPLAPHLLPEQPDAAFADLLNVLGDMLACAETGIGRVSFPPAHYDRLREAVRQVSLRAQRADSLLLPIVHTLLKLHAQGGRGQGWAEAWKRLRTTVGLIESGRV